MNNFIWVACNSKIFEILMKKNKSHITRKNSFLKFDNLFYKVCSVYDRQYYYVFIKYFFQNLFEQRIRVVTIVVRFIYILYQCCSLLEHFGQISWLTSIAPLPPFWSLTRYITFESYYIRTLSRLKTFLPRSLNYARPTICC